MARTKRMFLTNNQMIAIRLKEEGYNNSFIAKCIGVSREAFRKWFKDDGNLVSECFKTWIESDHQQLHL